MTNERQEDGRDPTEPGPAPEWVDAVRESYHAPPEAPRDEMWAAIRAGMAESDGAGRVMGGVVDLAGERVRRGARSSSARPRPLRSPAAWAVAAAALLVLGIGIGRWSATGPVLPT